LWKSYTGESAGDRFGSSLYARFNYLVVGAPGRNSDQGKVYLYWKFGANPDITKTGESTYDEFGTSVWIGNTYDMHSRDYVEFASGAPGRNSSTGKVYSSKVLGGEPLWALTGGATYDEYGFSVTGGKDVEGTVTLEDDLAIGAPGRSSSQGSVYVYDNDGKGGDKRNDIASRQPHDLYTARIIAQNLISTRGILSFTLPENTKYRLMLFDVMGRTVKTTTGVSKGGIVSYIWDAKDNHGFPIEAGIYFYRLESDNTTLTGKITVCK
jgi:hypothetical protein